MRRTAEDFQAWIDQPFDLSVSTVAETMQMLCRHPVALDSTSSDQFDFSELSFRNFSGMSIFTEDQGVYEFFVQHGDENTVDPGVYFISSIDLTEFGGPKDYTPVLACDSFQDFVWQCIAQTICIREERGNSLSDGVRGITFDSPIDLPSEFSMVPVNRFPNGVSCRFNGDVICEPTIGYATFRDAESEISFIQRFNTNVTTRWG